MVIWESFCHCSFIIYFLTRYRHSIYTWPYYIQRFSTIYIIFFPAIHIHEFKFHRSCNRRFSHVNASILEEYNTLRHFPNLSNEDQLKRGRWTFSITQYAKAFRLSSSWIWYVLYHQLPELFSCPSLQA